LPQRGEEAVGALVARDVVGLRQGFDGKLALLAGEFRQYRFEVAIDDAELAARTDPVPVVEHRILARKIEQLRAELVEKPPMMLGFVVCVRHAVLRTMPMKYCFHNRAEPSRAHAPRHRARGRGLLRFAADRQGPRIREPPDRGLRSRFDRGYGRAGLS
jgi:hypothetical protein